LSRYHTPAINSLIISIFPLPPGAWHGQGEGWGEGGKVQVRNKGLNKKRGRSLYKALPLRSLNTQLNLSVRKSAILPIYKHHTRRPKKALSQLTLIKRMIYPKLQDYCFLPS
jgi:hypothetical protein